MSEQKITVSDGTNFYLVPLSDVEEACADGFYIPSHRDRTIVSDGKDVFEIPLVDLPDARADGFYDVLAAELEVVRDFCELVTSSEFEGITSPVAGGLFAGGTAVLEAPRSMITAEEVGSTDEAFPDPDDVPDVPQLQSEEEPDPGPLTFAARVHQFFHPDAAQRRRLAVLATNAAVHGGILFVLAAIFLPSMQKEEFVMITSSFEPETSDTEELEMMEVEQLVELDDSEEPSETVVDSLVESMDVVDVDINDLQLAQLESTIDLNSKSFSAKTASEMGGRSKAGRSAMVAKMGGSAASEKAVTEGLKWMQRHQMPDGGWSYDHTGGECKGSCSQPGTLGHDSRNGATGMAILAMLGAGHTPFEGDFQESVLKGVQYLLAHSSASASGLDLRGPQEKSSMYVHAIATTALCETLAMLQQEVKDNKGNEEDRGNNRKRLAVMRQIEPAALAAINFISNAQHRTNGSWGYTPGSDGDTSILGWQVMALKSAVHAKIPVNPNTVRGANLFLNQVQDEKGMYGYRTPEGKPSTTAIGLVCRMLSGMSREEPRLKLGVDRLSALGPDNSNMYYNYYATQVMLHYGGDHWTKWNSVMRDRLVNSQIKEGHAAGSWNLADAHGASAGRLYMTCLCTMTLEVYYRHLPLYGVPEEADDAAEKSDVKGTKTSQKSSEKSR